MRVCENCGTELTDEMAFCSECGKEVTESAQTENNTEDQDAAKTESAHAETNAEAQGTAETDEQQEVKKPSKIGNFLREYKTFSSLSTANKVMHIVIPLLCVIFIALCVSSDNTNIVKSNSELGYDFNATLDDFVENWNTATKEIYGESSPADISMNLIKYARDESSGEATYSVYTFEEPFNKHMAVGLYVNKDTGNIGKITYTIDREFLIKADDNVKYNYKYNYSRRIFGCLMSSDDVSNRIDSALDSENGVYYKDNIITQFSVETYNKTDMFMFSMMAATKDCYKSLIQRIIII